MSSKPGSGKIRSSSSRAGKVPATPIRFQIPTGEVAAKLGVTVAEFSAALKAGSVVVEYKMVGGGFRSSFTYDGRTVELAHTPVVKH